MLFINKAFLQLYLNKESTVVFTVSYILCEEHDIANNNVAEASYVYCTVHHCDS